MSSGFLMSIVVVAERLSNVRVHTPYRLPRWQKIRVRRLLSPWPAPPCGGNTKTIRRNEAMLNRSMTTTLDRMLTLNRALDEAFTSSAGETARVWVPAIDLIEKKDAYIVRAELP